LECADAEHGTEPQAVIAARSLDGRRPLEDETKLAIFETLRDERFRDPATFRAFASAAAGKHWSPAWASDATPREFIEQWRRLLVRLRVASIVADDGFPISDELAAKRGQYIIQLAAQSAVVAHRNVEEWAESLADATGAPE
jgi:hypothetical protein